MSALTYVYCLVRRGRRPAIPAGLVDAGIPGGRDLRAVAAGENLWLIVASVPEAEYNEAALTKGLQNLDWVAPRAMGHEAVIEHFLTAPAVLPMQLLTLFTSDERALGHVSRQRREIERILARLDGKLEWGLRLTFDEQAARDDVEAQHATARSRKGAGGAAYLARKRDLLDVRRTQLAAARSEADALFAALTREAADARRRQATEAAAPGSRLLLDAAFLVPRSKTRGFRSAVKRSAKQIGAAGLVVSLTGPWPPYNFISAPERKKARGKTAH